MCSLRRLFTACPKKLAKSSTILALLAALLLSACGPTYVTNTRIPYTAEKQELADIVEKYRVALEERDIDTLKTLISKDYYENASTTDDATDDYGYDAIEGILADLKSQVSAAKVEIDITAIQIVGEAAIVDLSYKSHYLYSSTGEDKHWETASDKNRITFQREDDTWRVISGL